MDRRTLLKSAAGLTAVVVVPTQAPAEPVKVDAPKHDRRVLFMCQECEEHNPEGAVSHREDIAIMPDGTWLCSDCYWDCEKTAYGMVASSVEDFEFPDFEDLPRPPIVPIVLAA